MPDTACGQTPTDPDQADNDGLRGSIAMLLHELRNGHNGIQGMVRLLCHELPADAAGQRYVRLLNTLCAQQIALLDDLLLLARTRTQPLRLYPSPTNVHDLVDQVCLPHAEAALAKGLILGQVIEPGVPQACQVDAQRLHQVLGNLVANAIQYTATGTVSLTVRATPAPAPDRVVLSFQVRDTGSGLTDAALARLGRLFERLDSDATSANGSGVGIAVAHRLVQAMGGTLAYTSTPGEGTLATVVIEVGRA